MAAAFKIVSRQKGLFFGRGIITPGTPDMQPRDVNIESFRCIATAMDDLDSLNG